ncbi:MAG: repressor LexA [Candidatus Magasanikbacteria bacterium RIFOXYC12_FULL_33_11]|uniref:LexA repressor n=1 Tax=Candidatus Magasanikbacteria bacterium RIFOXYC12_FULL_33_11 TaxID=1798701 RepID=A0A1F6NP38_9BACT|nr:MAG: repressor LexA [Candidatus Magasanikbacteria bacterium RIFOXYC12_FULL_33_11]
MNTLTKRQKEILDYVSEYIQTNGYSPYYEEISEKFGLSALSTVHEHISELVDKGYLEKDERKERGLYLPKKRKQYLEIPLVGQIACGQPIEAIEDKEEVIKVAREQSLRGNLYALRAKGDSMIGDGIFDGDIIIAKKQESAENGDTVVAILDDNQATLKKYYLENDKIKLQPANPEYKAIYRKEVEIRGVVVKIIRNLK